MVVAPTKKHASPRPMSTRVTISHSSARTRPRTPAVDPDDERAADHQHPAAEAVTDAPGERPQQDGADREGAHRDPHCDVVAPEELVDVARDDGEHRTHRREVAEARDDHDHEPAGQERRLRPRRASARAPPHDARARSTCLLERRPLLDHLPILHDLGRHGKSERADQPTATPEHRDEPPLLERAVHDLHLVVTPEVADGLDLAVVLVGPHERDRRVRLRFVTLAPPAAGGPRPRPARRRWSSARAA